MKDVSDLCNKNHEKKYIAMTRAIYLKMCKGFANSTWTWKPQCKDNLVMLSCTGATSAHTAMWQQTWKEPQILLETYARMHSRKEANLQKPKKVMQLDATIRSAFDKIFKDSN